MAELQAFFHMGGYAWYVWPAFLISLLVLVANVMFSKAQYRRVLRETAIRAEIVAQKKSHANTKKKFNQ